MSTRNTCSVHMLLSTMTTRRHRNYYNNVRALLVVNRRNNNTIVVIHDDINIITTNEEKNYNNIILLSFCMSAVEAAIASAEWLIVVRSRFGDDVSNINRILRFNTIAPDSYIRCTTLPAEERKTSRLYVISYNNIATRIVGTLAYNNTRTERTAIISRLGRFSIILLLCATAISYGKQS